MGIPKSELGSMKMESLSLYLVASPNTRRGRDGAMTLSSSLMTCRMSSQIVWGLNTSSRSSRRTREVINYFEGTPTSEVKATGGTGYGSTMAPMVSFAATSGASWSFPLFKEGRSHMGQRGWKKGPMLWWRRPRSVFLCLVNVNLSSSCP